MSSTPTSPADTEKSHGAQDGAGSQKQQQQSVVSSACQGPLEFERQHVHDVYDAIAEHFSSTRYKPWPRVREFADQLPVGSLVADVGCGNGKNLCLRDSCIFVGCDRSLNLLRIAAGQRLEVAGGDAMRTPFRDSAFDAAISIAVIHHFACEDRRVEAIAELGRIVKPGGQVLIYVWAVEQPPKKNRVAVVPETASGSTEPPANPNTTAAAAVVEPTGDVFVPWEVHNKFDREGTVYSRYYHLFRGGELEALCDQASRRLDETAAVRGRSGPSSLVVESSYYDKENWCVVLRRH
jgi:SAM-dependent methyltransferase